MSCSIRLVSIRFEKGASEMSYDQSQIAESIKEAIESGRTDVVRILSQYVDKSVCEITTDDGEPEDLTGEGASLWVESTHCLVIDGMEVAEWTRCTFGTYGSQGRSEMVGVWCTEEDTEGDDGLPEMVKIILDTVGLEDEIPSLLESEVPNHPVDPNGEYCVYWETVGDDAGPLKRYATREQASEMCDVFSRSFAQSNPSGGTTRMLCGHSVRELVDE